MACGSANAVERQGKPVHGYAHAVHDHIDASERTWPRCGIPDDAMARPGLLLHAGAASCAWQRLNHP
ncbi:hypothetical protein XAP412_530042 [Xanthomonas phaseoli pv. phaseoli]|uniref:Uncharacterized protein n=1 Tax=Xanthomonas campestris pv. phaseoli TaxID=317013 RepID=A0AB38E2D1_XANCH|nr:hypothetical protein XAP6984_580042 [Xanthomonas phaseoli pv. phaseoli]SON87424.1 hypothetical protein XAP412_530042 [Xanthomonas phaseoli pv. phaseoli]SON91233.1 hypothetical protein XAP7430_540043 [Xanthomonas phaseoli pv. phaseoli]